MQEVASRARGALTPGEALRGLAAFLLLMGMALGTGVALLYVGERPGPPPSWPSWEDVARALQATEPPIEAARYVASMAGWLALSYVAAVLLLRAVADTLVSVTRGVAWAQDLSRLVDVVTLPWVKRGVSGGLLAAALVMSLVKSSPELPRLPLRVNISHDEGRDIERVPFGTAMPRVVPVEEERRAQAEGPLAEMESKMTVSSVVASPQPEAAEAPALAGSQRGELAPPAQKGTGERPELPPPVTEVSGQPSERELPPPVRGPAQRKMVLPGVRQVTAAPSAGSVEVSNLDQGPSSQT